MQHLIVVVLVVVAYNALAAVSYVVAYSPADAWTVWLASGVVFGTLLVARRASWPAVLAGGFVGAAAFAVYLGSPPLDALGYGAIEAIASGAAAFVVSKLSPLPLMLDRPRDLAAIALGGALVSALTGATFATAWHVASGGAVPGATFRLWALSNFLGMLVVAPLIVAWAQFRLRRSGGMTMPQFAAGAVACLLLLGTMWLLFDARPGTRFGGSAGETLTYLPILFMALVALLWGSRGSTLAAFVGALIAIVNTAQKEGPFAGSAGWLGDPELEVQAYVLAISLTGLLIAVLGAAQRNAVRAAREWRTRFEAAIGAHGMLAYEWDPASGRIVVTGDAAQLVGVPSAKIVTLADWLALVAAADRERVATRFDERVRGQGAPDTTTYLVTGPGGAPLAATDEARAIRDHDGELHRIVGLVRVSAATPAGAGA
ncbi:MAG: MASE1 domain-containing protein [Burkholderiales bacterium]